MRKGVGKFDLRDDEWYMVEDEFLQTAELFTRHLHLREYERLKEIVQYKKDIVRPVVASAKPSEERQIQIQTEKKTKTQKAALEDVFGSSGKGNIDDYLGAPKRATIPKDNHTKQRKPEISDSDSEDLDNLPKPTVPKRSTSDAPFVKPAPPSKPRTPAPPPVPTPDKSPRKRRQSTFSFDDYSHDPPSSPPAAPPTSNTRLTSPQKPRVQFSQTAETSKVPASSRPARSINSLFDDDDLPRGNPISKEQTERLARRQVEREKKKKEEKKKSIGLDDIPTFLF